MHSRVRRIYPFHLEISLRRFARRLKPGSIAVLGLALLMTGLAPGMVASASIGASSSPLTTAAPDLRTAAVADAAEKRVRFCFDQSIANFGTSATSFHLLGYNDVVTADGTSIGTDADPNCVLVDFDNSDSAVTQYTVGTSDDSAVTNAANTNSNVDGATALSGTSLGVGGIGGRTTGPDMTNGAKDGAIPNDVLYTYDEILDETSCDDTKLGLWKSDSTTPVFATGCSVTPGSTVARASFANTTNAVRFFSLAGAVADRGGDSGANPDLSPLGSTNAAITCTPAPANCTADLTGVSRIDDNTVDYTFDKGDATLPTPVAPSCDESKFFVFEEDSSVYSGSGACDVRANSASNLVVRITGFGTTNFSSFETPTAGVSSGAFSGSVTLNTHGALPIPLGTSKEASGFSDAPDLEFADFDTSLSRVTYNLDENVDPASVTTSTNFCVVDNDDAVECGAAVAPVSASNKQVVIAFTPTQINTAVGALMKTGAASDFAGNDSAEASVGRGAPPAAGTLQFSSSSFSVSEGAGGCPGGGAQLTVTRTGGSSGTATVNFATSNGSATAGNDYTSTSSPPPLSWANGDSSSKTICVPIIQDFSSESSETFTVSLSGATGAALGSPSTATVTITDDDGGTGNLAFSASTYSVGEAAGTATITVVRSGGSTGTVTVQFATSNGTATAGSDYTATSGTLTFGAGVTSQSFLVAITNDTADEVNETVNLSLSNAQGGAGLTAPTSAVLTIVDDDTNAPGALALSSASYEVDEGASQATITVVRSGGSTGQVTVEYDVTGSSATSGTDFTATSGTLTFAAGDVSETFSIPIIDDSADESDETASIALSAPTGGATLGSPSTATLTILDDDVAGKVTVRSGVTLRYKAIADQFRGRVFFPNGATSEQAALCRRARSIVLRKARSGAFVSSTFTSPTGRWHMNGFANPDGRYVATVGKKVLTLDDGSKLVCTRGQSRTLTL